jgi:phenylacetate-CoA ligase
LDLYSMNETGPIAVRDTNLSTAHFKLLQPQLWVEILRSDQTPAKPGEVGEVTLSGAFNHCMPLLRYRTGDFAALECVNGRWCLSDLHGRATVYFVDAWGQRHNNLEITHALQALPLRQWQLHQATDLRLRLSITPFDAPLQALCLQQLHALLGPVSVDVERLYVASDGSKLLQYSSDLD